MFPLNPDGMVSRRSCEVLQFGPSPNHDSLGTFFAVCFSLPHRTYVQPEFIDRARKDSRLGRYGVMWNEIVWRNDGRHRYDSSSLVEFPLPSALLCHEWVDGALDD